MHPLANTRAYQPMKSHETLRTKTPQVSTLKTKTEPHDTIQIGDRESHDTCQIGDRESHDTNQIEDREAHDTCHIGDSLAKGIGHAGWKMLSERKADALS